MLQQVILQTMDMCWVDHLEVMDYMRSSVNLRAYGQRDPLVEYKKEGLRLFKDMEFSIGQEVLKFIPQVEQNAPLFRPSEKLIETREGAEGLTAETAVAQNTAVTDAEGNKVGRNDPCFCGSGKKYKHCHGK
jgi:preprotein translocase subunit SecA